LVNFAGKRRRVRRAWQKLSLQDVRCPAYLLAGKVDDITLGAGFSTRKRRWAHPGRSS
jgi:hypothetical protein